MERITRIVALTAMITIAAHSRTAAAADGAEGPSPSAKTDTQPLHPSPAAGGVPIGGQEEIPKPPAPGAPSQPGYVINTAQGDTLLVGGYVHFDVREFVGPGSSAYPDQFLLRQVRPVLEGTIRRHFDYRLLTDFANGKLAVQEAFGDVRFLDWLKFRFGKFKSPVGLERLQNSNAVVFAERAFPTNLAPNRDTGVQVFGDVGGVLTYAVAYLDGAVDNGVVETDTDNDKEVAARVFLTPFARTRIGPLKGLGFGASGTVGSPKGTAAAPQLPTYLSPGQNTILTYASGSTNGTPDPAKTVVASGQHLRWDLQGYWYWGPVGVQGEYISSKQQVKKGTAELSADNRAWEVTGSVVLTGEKATFRMIVPDRPFDPAAGAWGAVELAGRFQQVRFDEDLFTNAVFADARQQVRRAEAWGAGINWYLDRSFRFMASYDRTRFAGGASNGGVEADRKPEQVFIGRAQVVF